tara:strand:- start:1328 stop:2311 length:984 start_codon:yes stop_codon:yes gene_type:complete
MIKKILITGGAGYVGSALADELVSKNYDVSVIDLCIYGREVFKNSNKINLVVGDIRDTDLLKKIIPGHDAVIHLACISNDPSFELNPELGKSINLDAFEPIVKISKDNGVKRFIYASSSSVYGIKEEKNVHEEMELKPLTDYSKFKVNCEEICLKYNSKDFDVLVIRPATVCGYSMRQRFDLVVNILTNLALNNKPITVFGGEQLRPNIHIKDMVRAYLMGLTKESNLINGKIFNAGYDNQKVIELADIVKTNVNKNTEIIQTSSNDNRSYHISSEKIKRELGFKNEYNIGDAVKDIKKAYESKLFNDSLNNEIYFNVKMMKKINLK